MNYYKLNHGTYPGITHVYFNCTPEELIKHYNSKHKIKLSDSVKECIDDKSSGLTITEGNLFIVYIPKFQNKSNYYQILTHELLHATFRALEYYGVNYNNNADNSEPFTYFLDYLVGQLYKQTFITEYPN